MSYTKETLERTYNLLSGNVVEFSKELTVADINVFFEPLLDHTVKKSGDYIIVKVLGDINTGILTDDISFTYTHENRLFLVFDKLTYKENMLRLLNTFNLNEIGFLPYTDELFNCGIGINKNYILTYIRNEYM